MYTKRKKKIKAHKRILKAHINIIEKDGGRNCRRKTWNKEEGFMLKLYILK